MAHDSERGAFHGRGAFEDLTHALDAFNIQHPHPYHMISSRLLAKQLFTSVEQWLQALKVWYHDDAEYIWSCKGDSDVLETTLTTSNRLLCQILRATEPKIQRGLGNIQLKDSKFRKWRSVSTLAVTMSIIARAEVCPDLREITVQSDGRKFIHASEDIDWGIGVGMEGRNKPSDWTRGDN